MTTFGGLRRAATFILVMESTGLSRLAISMLAVFEFAIRGGGGVSRWTILGLEKGFLFLKRRQVAVVDVVPSHAQSGRRIQNMQMSFLSLE
jgi:hypothetical protein